MSEPAAGEVALATVPVGATRPSGPERRAERGIVRAARGGSPEAIEDLVRMFWGDAHRIALGVVADPSAAEDVAQEALLAAVANLASFDRRRPFRPWLYRITTNKALDYLRARERRAEMPLDEARASTAQSVDSDASLDSLDALRVLEPRERAAVVLKHLIGMSSEEIGEVLGMKAGSVRSLIHRALARARTEYEGDPDE